MSCIREWALVQCKRCPYLLIVRRGQILAWCPNCERISRLADIEILWSSEKPDELHFLISCIRGWWGRGFDYIPTHLFSGWIDRYRSRSSDRGWSHRQAGKAGSADPSTSHYRSDQPRGDERFDQPAPDRRGGPQADWMELERALVSTA